MKKISALLLLISVTLACQQNPQTQERQQMIPSEMVRIAAGTVDTYGNGDTHTVKTFYIDKNLVTYEQYNQFIEAGGYTEKKYWSPEGLEFLEAYAFSVPSTYHEKYLKKSGMPATGVSWYEAEAYAKWRGVRLPTAAEWTLACQGNNRQRFPWGNAFDFDAVDYRTRLVPYPIGSNEKNVSSFGVFDLVGNVWQWCQNTYEDEDFRRSVTPTGTRPGTQKILKGGGWMSLRKHFESDYLYYDKPHHRLATYGFRCAKDAE